MQKAAKEVMNSLSNIAPIVLLILSGFVIKSYVVTAEDFWKATDKLVYYIFFPALLLVNIGTAEFDIGLAFSGLATAVMSTAFVAAAIFIYKYISAMENKRFSSVFQGSVRYNSYIFIALSSNYFGDAGAALSGIFVGVMIIFTNVISVIILNIYGQGGKMNVQDIAFKTLANPLIAGALLGVGLNISGISLHTLFIADYLYYLGTAAMPLSLLSIGAGLIFSFDRTKTLAISAAVFAKLILLPACAVVILSFLPLPLTIKAVTVLYCAVPCASNAYILSRQMGGDSDVMASVITWGTLLSPFSIYIFMHNYAQ